MKDGTNDMDANIHPGRESNVVDLEEYLGSGASGSVPETVFEPGCESAQVLSPSATVIDFRHYGPEAFMDNLARWLDEVAWFETLVLEGGGGADPQLVLETPGAVVGIIRVPPSFSLPGVGHAGLARNVAAAGRGGDGVRAIIPGEQGTGPWCA